MIRLDGLRQGLRQLKAEYGIKCGTSSERDRRRIAVLVSDLLLSERPELIHRIPIIEWNIYQHTEGLVCSELDAPVGESEKWVLELHADRMPWLRQDQPANGLTQLILTELEAMDEKKGKAAKEAGSRRGSMGDSRKAGRLSVKNIKG